MNSANENDQWAPHKDSVYRAAKAVLANYDEFGVEGGIDEYMEGLRRVLANAEHNSQA